MIGNLNIKNKLLLYVQVLVFVFLGINSYVNHNIAKDEVINEVHKEGIAKVKYSSTKIESYLTEMAQVVKMNALYLTESIEELHDGQYDTIFFLKHLGHILKEVMESNKERTVGVNFAFDKNVVDDMEFLMPWWTEEDGKIVPVITDFSTYRYNDPDKKEEFEWFHKPKELKKLYWCKPYFDKGGREVDMITVSVPIFEHGKDTAKSEEKFVAVANLDIDLTNIRKHIENVKMGNAEAFLLANDGQFIAHSTKKEYNLKKNALTDIKDNPSEGTEGWTTAISDMLKEKNAQFTGLTVNHERKILFYSKIPSSGYVLGIMINEDEVLEGVNYLTMVSIVMMVVAFILVFLINYFLSNKLIVQPINRIVDLMDGMSYGNLTLRAKVDTKDEIGHIGERFNVLSDNMTLIVTEIKDTSTNITESSKNVSNSIQVASSAIEAMSESIEQEKSSYQNLHFLIQNTAGMITQTLASIDSVAESINSQAAVVEESSSAIQEMAQSITSVNDTSQHADRISKNLLSVTKDGAESVKKVVEAGRDIGDFSKQISEMVGLISSIAEQTNLLAMNAAIEAAHAGDYGKGFAVVADEIRKLAENSGNSAREITAIIKEVTQKIDNSISLGEQALAGLNKILEDVNESTQINAEISSAMEEQAKGVHDILQSMNTLLDVTEQVKNSTQEQRKGNKDIYEHLNTIRQDSSFITQAIEDQASQSQSIIKETNAIGQAANENKIISEKLLDIIKQFYIGGNEDSITTFGENFENFDKGKD